MNRCKICKSVTISITDTKTSKVYHKCLECDYIFLNKNHYLDTEKEKEHYDNHHNNLESLGYVKMFEKLIEEFVPPNIETALDYGCGEGEVLPILLQRRGIACDRYDLYYHPDKIYEDRCYDMIVSTEVFEHLDNPLQSFETLLSHIKKDGYLLLMTYFHPQESKEFLQWFYIQDITHIGFFSIKTFEYLAQKYNLKILKHNQKNTVLFQKV